jgi:hypothetical protein
VKGNWMVAVVAVAVAVAITILMKPMTLLLF